MPSEEKDLEIGNTKIYRVSLVWMLSALEFRKLISRPKKHTQYHDICFLANRQVNDSDFRFTTSECKENAITWYIIDIYRFRLFCYATIYDFGFVKLIQILYVSNDTPYTMCSIHVINIVANYKQIFNGKS